MNTLFKFFIIFGQLILGNDSCYKNLILDTGKKIKMLSEYTNTSEKSYIVNEIKRMFKPLVKEICDNYEFEIEKVKYDFYINKNNILQYIKKTYDTVEYLVDNIEKIGVKKCANVVGLFSECEEKNFMIFFAKAIEFRIKYKKQIYDMYFFDLNIGEYKEQEFEEFFLEYKKYFRNLKFEFQKIDIMKYYTSVGAFKNETNESVINQFNILKKIISAKKNTPKTELNLCSNYDIEFEFLQLSFHPIMNFKLCTEYQTVANIKSKYNCEMKRHSVKLANHKYLHKKFNDVIKSIYEIEKIAKIADDRFKNFNKLTNESLVINLYNKGVKNFIKQFSEFHNEFYNICQTKDKNSLDYSTNIVAKILENYLDTKSEFKHKVTDVFKLILSNNSILKMRFECMYSNHIFEDAEKFIQIYHLNNDFFESCIILNSNDIGEANAELAKYLNYKKEIIYDLIEIIDYYFSIINTKKEIYLVTEGFKKFKMFNRFFISKSFICSLHKAFEKYVDKSIYNSEFYMPNCNRCTLDKITIENLIIDIKENEIEDLCYLAKQKVNFMSIVLDMLKIVADNIIEERDCYLRGWEDDNEITVSFKKILTLFDKFIDYSDKFIY